MDGDAWLEGTALLEELVVGNEPLVVVRVALVSAENLCGILVMAY